MNIDILTQQQADSLRRLIGEAQNIVICCHKSPDGDALGSSLAWASYLRTKGKNPQIVVPDAWPDFLQWLPGTADILRHDKHKEQAEELVAEADLLFCLDFGSTSRVDELQPALDGAEARKVMIDHHLDPDIETALTISRPEMSSTSELIARIIWQLGDLGSVDRQCAACIYCGMMTDTGGFTYNSSAPEIFFIISQLLAKGIDKDKIYRNVYNNFSPWAIRLRGYLMCHKLNVVNGLGAAYYSISREDMRGFHFLKGDAEGLVNEPLRIKGMRLSISLREDDRRPGIVWVSLRSVDDFPCNKMAEEFFNGGGHLNASGGHLRCSLREAEKITRQAIQHYAHLL